MPGRSTLPDTEKIFVPVDFSVPMPEYHAAPFSTMWGIVASVSTLLMTVGAP